MYNKYYEQLDKQKKILESEGFTVCYIMVFGSQNYGMDVYTDEYMSDLDMKAIVVPTLDDLIYNTKPYSKIHTTEWGECDVKDIRKWTETLCKGNPTYIETICTDYYIIDLQFETQFREILNKRDVLIEAIKASTARAIFGMMMMKHKALCHPYPTIKHKIDKWGYDGKQLLHTMRLYFLMVDYFVNKVPYIECLVKYSFHQEHKSFYVQQLELAKYNKLSLEDAKDMSEKYIEMGKILKDKLVYEIDEKHVDYSAKYDIIDLGREILKRRIINDVLN